MKKIIFVVLFIFASAILFGQTPFFGSALLVNESFWTSEGHIHIAMSFDGRNVGQQRANVMAREGAQRVHSLSRGQEQAIDSALRRFQNRAGDTFSIGLVTHNSQIIRFVIVEMNSATDWGYWAFAVR